MARQRVGRCAARARRRLAWAALALLPLAAPAAAAQTTPVPPPIAEMLAGATISGSPPAVDPPAVPAPPTQPPSTPPAVPVDTVAPPPVAPAALDPPAPAPGVAAPASPPAPPAAASGVAAPASPPAPAAAAGRITLAALNEDGLATGPPGAGITVTGAGFPAPAGRAMGPLAAPLSLAQGSPACGTVYFHLDGLRIGAAKPDPVGSVLRHDLSVPGRAEPGTHAVTASCRSSGSPVLAAADFLVTDASLHRSAFATSLHRPDHVDFSAGALLPSALAALGLLMLIAFPAELFNSTLEAHYDEVRGWFGLRPRAPGAGTGVSNVAVFLFFLALSGPLWFAMQRSSALDMTTFIAAAGLSIATAIVVLSSDLPTYLHLRRRYGERASVVALPGTLIVALVCVVLSRAVRFEPGYFYGLVGGLAFSRHLRNDTTGRLAAGSVAVMITLSVASWLALAPVARMADAPDPSGWPIFFESVLGSIFWAALDSLVIALLPLRLLAGSKIVAWRRLPWGLLYAATLFAFVHILLRPGTGYVSDTSRSPTVVVVVLFVAFAVLSFSFWGYFRFRAPRPEEKATAAV